MKAHELIALLSTFPADARVVIDGYEGGFDDVVFVRNIGIAADVNTPDNENHEDYYGQHFADKISPTETAVWIRSGMARGDSPTVQAHAQFEKFQKSVIRNPDGPISIEQMNAAIIDGAVASFKKSIPAIDDALEQVAASNARIEKLESK